MLHDQGLPLFLWAEACNTTVYLQNRSLHRALGHMTLEEAFSGKKPNIGHLRIFGCITYSYIPKEKRTKIELTAEKGIFVGYIHTVPQLLQVQVQAGGQPKWLQDTLRDATSVAEPKRLVRESRPPERFCSYMAMASSIFDSEPSSFEEAASQQVWREAMQEEYSSIMKNDVWEVVPRSEGKYVVSSRWLYKVKHATYGSIEKFKARFVARGFSQVEGVDYEETFSPMG
eukprot:PITA_15555